MKTKAILALTLLTIFCFPLNSLAQPLPPEEHNNTNDQNPPGGGAPIAGGIGEFVILSLAYGGYKIVNTRKEKKFSPQQTFTVRKR